LLAGEGKKESSGREANGVAIWRLSLILENQILIPCRWEEEELESEKRVSIVDYF
jgi:hypothetical protein